jgi:hypothetical protein
MQLKSDEYAACLNAIEARSPRELVELAEAVNECVNVGPLVKGEIVSVIRSNQFVRALVHNTQAEEVTPDGATSDHGEDKPCCAQGPPLAPSQYNLLLEEEEGWIFANYKKDFSNPLTYSRSQIHARAPDLRQPAAGDTARRLFELSGDEDETVATTDPECVWYIVVFTSILCFLLVFQQNRHCLKW